MPTVQNDAHVAAEHGRRWQDDAEGQLRAVCREQRATIARLESEVRRLKRELSAAKKVASPAPTPTTQTAEPVAQPRIVSLVRKR